MAIKMTAAELTTFKNNLEMLLPFHDHRLLNRLAQCLYSSSNYNYEVVEGLGRASAVLCAVGSPCLSSIKATALNKNT